jgi:Phosphoesterase family
MPGSNSLASIQHIVVLMLENRSFDHMLGFLYTGSGNVSPAGQPYDGLTGSESNPASSGPPFSVFKIEPTTSNAYFMPGADPGEGYMATNDQLFGSESAPANSSLVPSNDGFIKDFAYTLGWQSREGGWSIVPGTTGQDIMGCFAPETLPVLSGLARGYAVCDQWFSAVPTETLPNRAFACAGTSQGHMDDKTHTFTSPSIFGLRVPAVLVSPLTAPGTVFRVPAGSTPLDHTSIPTTVQQRWGLPPLTARDAAAPGFGDVLTLTAPRTDDVLAGVTVPVATEPGPAAGQPSHLQEVQAELVSRQFPAGVSPAPGKTGPAPVTDAALASYIRAHA